MSDPREITARDPNTPVNILEELSEATWTVRRALGCNASLPRELVEKLASDSNEDVRASVASNPIVSPDILTELSKDRSRDIAESLAQNTSTPVPILEKLFKNTLLREELSRNTSLPRVLLEEVIEKDSKYLAKIATITLKKKSERAFKEALLAKYLIETGSSERFKKLEEAVSSKKLKLFKDAIREVTAEEVTIGEYNLLAIVATELAATSILKHICKLADPAKEVLSKYLLIATRNNKAKDIKYLLEAGAPINAVDEEGVSALAISVERSLFEAA